MDVQTEIRIIIHQACFILRPAVDVIMEYVGKNEPDQQSIESTVYNLRVIPNPIIHIITEYVGSCCRYCGKNDDDPQRRRDDICSVCLLEEMYYFCSSCGNTSVLCRVCHFIEKSYPNFKRGINVIRNKEDAVYYSDNQFCDLICVVCEEIIIDGQCTANCPRLANCVGCYYSTFGRDDNDNNICCIHWIWSKDGISDRLYILIQLRYPLDNDDININKYINIFINNHMNVLEEFHMTRPMYQKNW